METDLSTNHIQISQLSDTRPQPTPSMANSLESDGNDNLRHTLPTDKTRGSQPLLRHRKIRDFAESIKLAQKNIPHRLIKIVHQPANSTCIGKQAQRKVESIDSMRKSLRQGAKFISDPYTSGQSR